MRGWVQAASWFVLGIAAVCATVPLPMGDAARGRELFRSQGCLTCHGLGGSGGRSAPDLSAHGGRGFSPAGMTALLWNHAPRMWAAMAKRGVASPQMSEQQAADLFAYFYAARYFDRPGDRRRGGDLFNSYRCTDCHGGSTAGPGGAPPASAWPSLGDPIALAQQMWNHAAGMSQAMAKQGIPHPELMAEDLLDLMAYVGRLSRAAPQMPKPGVGSAASGERIFSSKGCAGCHTGGPETPTWRTRFSLTDFAASLWNHAPKMPGSRPALSYEEMRDLVAYLGALQYFEERGNLDRGEQVFAKKKCAACHGQAADRAPDLSDQAGRMSSPGMTAAVWKHDPRMLEQMRRQRIAWPRFTATEMADLTAFLHGPRLKRR
ncbi:MAG: c-type cytochrome [Acidobacteria bacterium]|nr:c-type cytochrome [Acidobacteriota bacterium]